MTSGNGNDILDFVIPVNNLELLSEIKLFENTNNMYTPFFVIKINTQSGDLESCFYNFPFRFYCVNQQLTPDGLSDYLFFKDTVINSFCKKDLEELLSALDNGGIVYYTPYYHLNFYLLNYLLKGKSTNE